MHLRLFIKTGWFDQAKSRFPRAKHWVLFYYRSVRISLVVYFSLNFFLTPIAKSLFIWALPTQFKWIFLLLHWKFLLSQKCSRRLRNLTSISIHSFFNFLFIKMFSIAFLISFPNAIGRQIAEWYLLSTVSLF